MLKQYLDGDIRPIPISPVSAAEAVSNMGEVQWSNYVGPLHSIENGKEKHTEEKTRNWFSTFWTCIDWVLLAHPTHNRTRNLLWRNLFNKHLYSLHMYVICNSYNLDIGSQFIRCKEANDQFKRTESHIFSVTGRSRSDGSDSLCKNV